MLISETDFVVCDVETTGMSPYSNRITEICMLKLRNGVLVDSYESLVNPGQYIPPFITRLTGISNSLVQNAPPFSSVAEDVAKFIENAAFVAHNASFDWGFVNGELTRAGVGALSNNTLCTVKLSRRVIPGMRSYSLGKLAASLDIPIRKRHRARGDCEATTDLFRLLIERADEILDITDVEELIALQHAKPSTKPLSKKAQTLAEQILSFPDSPGVYFFRNARKEILYIGKAASLRTRVRSYFQPAAQSVRKIRALLRRASSVTYETTDTELHALLREAHLIAKRQPEFNSAMRRKKIFPYLRLGIENDFPRLEITTDIEDDGAEYFGPFRTFSAAEMALEVVNRLFQLRKCRDNLHPAADFSPCFYHQIHRCAAPCAELQTRAEYLGETDRVRRFLSSGQHNVVREIEAAMHERAAQLAFEEAAYFRDRVEELRFVFEKPLKAESSITSQHYVFALPASRNGAERTFWIFFIRSGQLRGTLHERAGEGLRRKLEREIAETYSQQALDELSQAASREMRIVSGWIRQHINDGVLVAMRPGAPSAEQAEKVAAAIGK